MPCIPPLSRARALALALVVSALAPAGAVAATPSQVGDGLHISTGALVDPAGRTWVADHNAGFCRMTEATEDEPARIEHPETPSDTTSTRTCLGGLLPHAAVGPDAAGAPAFHDPSPEFPNSGDEIAYVPDGASPSADVFRLRWDPDTKLFQFNPDDPRDKILMNGDIAEDRPRPTAVTLGPDGNLYVVFQRSATIQRVLAPASNSWAVQTIGTTSDGAGAASIAAGRDAIGAFTLYVGEATGIRALRPNLLLPNQITQPTPFDIGIGAPALPNREGVPGLAYDSERDILYAGTATELAPQPGLGAGVDDVYRFFPRGGGTNGIYASGFSMVGGVSLGLGGELLVVDDPALLDPAEPLGAGRMWRVGPPGARILSGPTNATGAQSPDPAFTNDATPRFTFAGGPAIECSLQPEGQPKAWVPCNSGSFTQPTALTEGATYRFAVRSVDGALVGRAHTRRFTVDGAGPDTPEIVSPDGSRTLPQRPYFEFASDEPDVAFECRLTSTGPWEPCATGRPYTFTTSGSRTLRLRAVDRAGNVSAGFDSQVFNVDGVRPRLNLSSNPSAEFSKQRTITFSWSLSSQTPETQSPAPGVRYGCRINDEPFQICGQGTSSGSKTYPDRPDGTYRFEVHAMDAAGNLGDTFTRTVNVDNVAPVVDQTQLRAVTGPSGTFPLRANEEADFRCSIDSTTLRALSIFFPCNTFIGLSAGVHTLRVQATDRAGNVGPVVVHPFTVSIPDREAPEIDITAPAQGAETQPNVYVEFDVEDPSVPVTVLSCRLDGAFVQNCASPHLLTNLADGQHTFSVTARDAAFNVATVTRTWTVKSRGRGGERDTIPQPPAPAANRVAARNLALNPLTGETLALETLAVRPVAQAAGDDAASPQVAVTLVADPGTTVVRLRLFSAPPAGAAAKEPAKRGKLLAQEFRRVKAERRVKINLSRKATKRLRAGRRYLLEVTPGTSRKRLGAPKTRTFSVKR